MKIVLLLSIAWYRVRDAWPVGLKTWPVAVVSKDEGYPVGLETWREGLAATTFAIENA